MSRISIRRVTITLAAVTALLAVLGLITQVLSPGETEPDTWAHVFDLDAEATLPAWFQSAMMLAIGALLWKIGSSGGPDNRFSRHWKFLAGVFVYLSADESASLHETLGFWISEHFGWESSLGVYVWLIPALTLLVGLGIASWKFLRHLPPRIRRTMVIAAFVYVAGAAGMEIVEALLDRLSGSFSFSMMTVVEETLEMAGLVLFIHALLSYLRDVPKGGTLVIEP